MILVLIMYAIFASSFPITKILLTYTTPFFLTGARMILGGALLIYYHGYYRRRSCAILQNQFWIYAQIIVIGIYLNYVARFWSIRYLTSVKASFIFNFCPLFTSFFAYLFFHEKVSSRQWIGYAIGFTALVPIFITSSTQEFLCGELWYISWPELAMLVSVIADSYKWVLIQKLVVHHTCSPLIINGISMLAGGALALSTSIPLEGLLPVSSWVPFSLLLLLYIFISNIISYNLYGHLLKKYTATFMSMAGFTTPLFASIWGMLLLHEHISWHFYLSTFILTIGLILFYRDEKKKKKLKQTLFERL